MDGGDVSADHVIAELVEMGFEFHQVNEAIEAVGPRLHDAVDYILRGSCEFNGDERSPVKTCSRVKQDISTHSYGLRKQSSITEHFQSSSGRSNRKKTCSPSSTSVTVIGGPESMHSKGSILSSVPEASESAQPDSHAYAYPGKLEDSSLENRDNGLFYASSSSSLQDQETGLCWEQKASNLLCKHFGFSSLKGFQKEALGAWVAHRDSLVLAATGSGKSLCFQIPALLTGKVVVVISPLISLMHDQCLKLAQCGISACFLGSGQPDNSVEHKAMSGMYQIVYVCPETVLRLIVPLQKLAENCGIALFAIDEAHCVSKWGHDFRPAYRRLSVLRENFRVCNLNFLQHDIPVMALTATATLTVREDIIKSLHMTNDTKIVLTSFFRPNLRFSVKHSRTSSISSYDDDFRELIEVYTMKVVKSKKEIAVVLDNLQGDSDFCSSSENGSTSDADEVSSCDVENAAVSSKKNQWLSDFLEDELDVNQDVDDLDVSCGEYCGNPLAENLHISEPLEKCELPIVPEGQHIPLQDTLGKGPTIIYVPTRKETLKVADYLRKFGVRASAYHAKLPKSHLRRVHEEFHRNCLEVH
ncbi:ATP-dependent DNA helicase Q-like SIM [Acorus calamus]|uniref:ATP-dependent DNA helicase Q-like SIM n=1 Tax=Acorus calamus TaxID=4465 RepID=A0AAV9F2I9_ACOCL|nr:ATP-dependent DNA helicase Q-like SIM [Acorus calamus]